MKLAPATPKGYRRLIPSVTALVEFEAVARLGSFTLAAHELGVTQAAVSRQIKFLEDLLGTRLFHRLHRSIALTGEGDALYRVVAESMQKIAGVFDRLASGPVRQELVLAATSAFSHFRLLSRLAALKAAQPELQLRLATLMFTADLRHNEIDVAVRLVPAGGFRLLSGKPHGGTASGVRRIQGAQCQLPGKLGARRLRRLDCRMTRRGCRHAIQDAATRDRR
ncbi:MAG: HTH-type transcriptional activator AmpR [Burkholderia lata]|uniref:HTH-type transcriptional activator AmpR n=3 Tax=Pseudomonadota TaxID=1224 RepID=A0A833V131_BURL3|nr:MAG: HTH-type transcriptional activator AmpR [Burkholderia lata]